MVYDATSRLTRKTAVDLRLVTVLLKAGIQL